MFWQLFGCVKRFWEMNYVWIYSLYLRIFKILYNVRRDLFLMVTITIIRFALLYNARVYSTSILDKSMGGLLLLFTI